MKEYEGLSKFKYRIIGNLFVALMLKIKETFWNNYLPIKEKNRSSQIVRKFKELLEHYIELAEGKTSYQFQAQDYAKSQILNPNYFSQVIKSKSGKSVTQWMSENNFTSQYLSKTFQFFYQENCL